MRGKDAVEKLAKVELYHEDLYEDEDFDGNWTYERYCVCDGTVGEVYKEEIEAILQDLNLLATYKIENGHLKEIIDFSKIKPDYNFYKAGNERIALLEEENKRLNEDILEEMRNYQDMGRLYYNACLEIDKLKMRIVTLNSEIYNLKKDKINKEILENN
jgi:hypothetical protein